MIPNEEIEVIKNDGARNALLEKARARCFDATKAIERFQRDHFRSAVEEEASTITLIQEAGQLVEAAKQLPMIST